MGSSARAETTSLQAEAAGGSAEPRPGVPVHSSRGGGWSRNTSRKERDGPDNCCWAPVCFPSLCTNPGELSTLKSCPFTSSRPGPGFSVQDVTRLESRNRPGEMVKGGSGEKNLPSSCSLMAGLRPSCFGDRSCCFLAVCQLEAALCSCGSHTVLVSGPPLPSDSSHELTSDPDVKGPRGRSGPP